MLTGYGVGQYGEVEYGAFDDTQFYGARAWGVSLYGAGESSRLPIVLGVTLRGKFGNASDPDPFGIFGIYRSTRVRGKRVTQRMKFYTPTNPRTSTQQAWRGKLADAMAAWAALTSDEKAAYSRQARTRGMSGMNLFVSQYLQRVRS